MRDGEIATQTGSIVTTPGFTATDFYKTGDGTLAAHHEHTLVVRRTGPLLLTAE